MYILCRVLKTGILAVLTVTSGLGNSYIKGDESCVKKLIDYCLMLYIIYVTLIMRLWDLYNLVVILAEFVMDSLLLSPPHLRRSFRFVINQSVGSCRVRLTPEVWSSLPCLLPKVVSNLLSTLYNLCVVLWYYPLFVAICEACLLKLTYGAYLILFLKSGVTKWYQSNADCRTQA